MEEEISSKKALTNMIWRFAERFGAQLVSLVVSIVIARILGPESYGTVAIISVFTTILYVFVDSGLGNSLIQKKGTDNLDFSTVFFFNIFMCLGLYVFLFIAAPIIAYIYNNSELVILIRVSGITLLISSIKNVQQAYVAKNLLFKKFFRATLGGTLCAAVVGIYMALAGCGVWALVISGLINNFIDTLILWITVKWRPEKCFSPERLKKLLSFGSGILLTNLFQSIYSSMYDLIIGKVYSTSDLAYYDRGKTIPNMVVNNVDDAINSVLLPVMSDKQDNLETVRRMTKRALKINMYIMSPVLVGFIAIAKPMIGLLLSDKWLPATLYLQIFAFVLLFRPLSTANLSAFKALGRSDLFFKLEILKDLSGILILLLTVRKGVFTIAIGVMINSFICIIINTWPSKEMINYGLSEQIRDLLPTFFATFVMGACVYAVNFLNFNNIITLSIQIPIGVVSYIFLSKIFKLDSYQYTLNLFKEIFMRK